MSDQVTQQDVNSTAWAACDTFRGVVDPAQYKDYILVMLFLKYISDQWADHYAEYQKEYGNNEERIRRKLERERFTLPYVEFKDEKTGAVTDRFLADFHALYARRKAANLGELINIVLDHIEEANKAKLEGVFRNIDFNSEANLGKTKDRNRRLENLLGDFAKLDLRPSRVSEDVIGDTYIYLIERFASDAGKKAGEFYTPKQVSKLLAQLATPKPGDRICDPTCGAGGLLIVRFGIMPILFIGGAASAATNLLFALLSSLGANLNMLVVTISCDNFSSGLATTAVVAYLSSLTSLKFSATQYALLSSIMLLLPRLLGGYSGTLVEKVGYEQFFVLTTLLGSQSHGCFSLTNLIAAGPISAANSKVSGLRTSPGIRSTAEW